MEGDIFNSLKYIWIILMKTTESGLFPVTCRYIFTVWSACFCLIGNKTVICHLPVLPTPFKYTYLCNSWLTQFDSVLFFYPHRMTCGILWLPQPGIEPVPHCSGSTVSYHWTTREFLTHTMFQKLTVFA